MTEYAVDKDAKWMSANQAAVFLGFSVSWVHHLVKTGRIESQSTPLGRLLSRASVEAYAKKVPGDV